MGTERSFATPPLGIEGEEISCSLSIHRKEHLTENREQKGVKNILHFPKDCNIHGQSLGWSCSPTQSCPKALGEASLVELTQKNNKRELSSDFKETHSTLLPMGFPAG